MMNSSVSSPVTHLQQYHHTHIQQQQQQISHSQFTPMQQPQPPTMMAPANSLPPPYSGPMQGGQTGPPMHISMHAPNATVVSQNCQMTMPTNSIVPPNAANSMAMHMGGPNRPTAMGGFSQHPGAGSVAMMAAKPQNPNTKFLGGPGGMASTGGFPNSQTSGQMGQNVAGGNMSYGMQQQMVFNNNTVPYSAHAAAAGMTQRQIHPSQMMSASSMNGGVQSLPNKHAQMMMQQEQMVPQSNMMPVNSNSVVQLRNGATVMSTPQNHPSYINMQGQVVNQMVPHSQQQTQQGVNVFTVGGPGTMKPNIVAGTQHQMGMMMSQQQGQPGMAPGGMNPVAGNGMGPSQMVLNRQRLLTLQQQQQMSMQKSHMMRQAVTPPASMEAASQHMGGSSSMAFQFSQQGNSGQGSMVGVPNRIMDTGQGGGGGMMSNCNSNQIPSPASNNSQIPLTASTAMIGAPHSVPASQEVMPPSPQVTSNPNAINQYQQPAMFTNNNQQQQSINSSFAKRQSTTPPVANARATPSPISRKNSTSAALKRRSSSTSSFDQGSEIAGGNCATSTNDLNEPTKVCRLTPVNVPPPNIGPHTQQQQQQIIITSSSASSQHYSKTPTGSSFTTCSRINNSQNNNNLMSSSNITTTTNNSNSTSCHYNTTLTLDAVHRKDSSCSINTDTHSSPDSGLGDSGSESSGCSSTPHNHHMITGGGSPQCAPTDHLLKGTGAAGGVTPAGVVSSSSLSSEQMLENLIQELGIEKLDHLPELLDIFDNDSVFSTNVSTSSSSCESNNNNNSQSTRHRAAHVAAP